MFRKTTHVLWQVLHGAIILFGIGATVIGTSTTIHDIIVATQMDNGASQLCS